VVPSDARIVDVRGLSVLPGLIDAHFHSRHTVVTPVEYELKRGVTTFRDPGHPFHFYDLVKASPEPMPRVFLCGGHLDGPPPVWLDQAVLIRDAVQARHAVKDHVDHGASAIKVYFRLPLEHVRAACAAARERGVMVTAHLELVDADDAIRAGVRGIEHVTSFGTALAAPEFAEQFRAKVRADSSARNQLRHWLWSKIDLESSTRVRPLLDLIIEKDVFVSPTLAIFERRAGEKSGTEDEARAFANMLRFVGLCHRAGARVVVGSHTAAPFAETGRAYQRELELLIDAGMSPLEAITAGTRQNARFFGIDRRLGTLEAGQTADLILVDGDPSTAIDALNNVRHVMLNGSWIGEGP
jgi:imidazolonepropionase-like amidohydrolase